MDYKMIKAAMDLIIIKQRLQNNYYSCADKCMQDINEIMSNCYAHKKPGKDLILKVQALKKLLIAKENKEKSIEGCTEVLEELFNQKHEAYAWPFYYSSIDYASCLGSDDYHNIIKKPMDLGTVKSKLKNNKYKSSKDFAFDVSLIFSNCYEYHNKDHNVVTMAKKLQVVFEAKMSKILPDTPLIEIQMKNKDKSSSKGSSGSFSVCNNSKDQVTSRKFQEGSNTSQDQMKKFAEDRNIKIKGKKKSMNNSNKNNNSSIGGEGVDDKRFAEFPSLPKHPGDNFTENNPQKNKSKSAPATEKIMISIEINKLPARAQHWLRHYATPNASVGKSNKEGAESRSIIKSPSQLKHPKNYSTENNQKKKKTISATSSDSKDEDSANNYFKTAQHWSHHRAMPNCSAGKLKKRDAKPRSIDKSPSRQKLSRDNSKNKQKKKYRRNLKKK